jgi:hypothetical protein
MTQYCVLASEGWQRYIYTKTPKNIEEKKKVRGVWTLRITVNDRREFMQIILTNSDSPLQ